MKLIGKIVRTWMCPLSLCTEAFRLSAVCAVLALQYCHGLASWDGDSKVLRSQALHYTVLVLNGLPTKAVKLRLQLVCNSNLTNSWLPKQVLSLLDRVNPGSMVFNGLLHPLKNSGTPGPEPYHWLQFNVIPKTWLQS